MTDSARLALCESEAEVPVKVTVALADAAFAAAVSVVFCGVPGVRLSVDGLAVTPEGSPLELTVIVPVKPLIAVVLTARFCDEPAVIERLAVESVRVKSGCGTLLPDERLDPHATKASKRTQPKLQITTLLNFKILNMATGR